MNSNYIGYDANGSPLSAEDYLKEELNKEKRIGQSEIDELKTSIAKLILWAKSAEYSIYSDELAQYNKDIQEAKKLLLT